MDNNNKNVMYFNPMGDTQREQWHTVVNMLNWKTNGEAIELCNELHRYIDFCEDTFDKLRKENKNETEF